MAGGAPRHWNAAVWVKEASDDYGHHAGPAKQGKGLLLMWVCAARHAVVVLHGSHGSHGMVQEVKLADRWGGAGRPARSAAQACGK